MEEDIYVEVALPIAQYKTFTYRINSELYRSLENKKLIGRRVLVPFRKQGLTGVIVEKTKEPEFSVKDVEEIPDKEPIFSEKEINVIKRISGYYISPIGMTVHFFIPDVLVWKKKDGKWIKGIREEKIYVPNVVSTTGIGKLSNRALELLEFILERGEVRRQEIVELGFSLNSLKTLLNRGLVKEEKLIFREVEVKERRSIYLKEKILKKDRYLFGYKTQEKRISDYIPLIYGFIKRGKGILIIFPTVRSVEICYRKLREKFGDKVFIYHDGISGKEKIKTWFSLRKLSGVVLVGTFSSSLISVKDLELIILEDEHSESYKPLRVPRFDTRRLIYEVSKEKGCSLIFSSTVPSVEAYFSVKKGIFKSFGKRKNLKRDTQLEVIPLNREKLLSEKLIDEIEKSSDVLVISNKKAYASFLFCKRCEEEIICPECEVPLRVYSKPEKFLKCELCGIRYEYIKTCPTCSLELVEVGFGIERVEEILRKRFGKDVSYFEEGKDTKVKLSTGIVDRELSYPEFEVVINIYPDFLLNINDFRGNEKYFRNILSGYTKAKKKYILITNSIENEAVVSLKNMNPDFFYDAELKKRQEFELPPFSKLILLTFEKRELSLSAVNEIFKNWIEDSGIEEINYRGAFYAYYSKMKGKNRIQILIKNMKEEEKNKLKLLYEKCYRKGIKLIIDVDPKEII